ncbi:transposase [Amycolatopsis sp. NPDC051716]|uniref:transposase n=1 Tax=Amycolatopsis sp. NPDC051716 TaxID=3155804 RepID=UPI003437C87F
MSTCVGRSPTWADGYRARGLRHRRHRIPEDGADSPGVARMYCGALGKTGNCQVRVSVHAVTGWASAAIDWRLFLPQSWDDTTVTDPEAAAEIRGRRSRSKIPDDVRHREKWRLALDMLDEITGDGGWGLPDRRVVADAGYGDATEFRLGLTERGLSYVVAVTATTTAFLADAVPQTLSYTPGVGPRTHRLLALHPARRHSFARPGADGEDPLAHRTRLP